MLSQPQETLELQQHKQSKAVAVTSLAFPTGDVNNFIVGSEEGTVYTACRHGSRAGILDSFEGHAAPVTGLSTHSGQGLVDFSHLFLTSSIDWTVKLWSLKENRPLHSFETNGDYVYDVAWSPTHPALFAAVDGTGRLDLWHLTSDIEVPTACVTVEGAPALNRVSGRSRGFMSLLEMIVARSGCTTLANSWRPLLKKNTTVLLILCKISKTTRPRMI